MDTTNTSINNSVVMLTVNVRLVERKVKSHVGRLTVTNVMTQSSTRGTMVRIEVSHPMAPMDEGAGASCKAIVATMGIEAEMFGAAPRKRLLDMAPESHSAAAEQWRSVGNTHKH